MMSRPLEDNGQDLQHPFLCVSDDADFCGACFEELCNYDRLHSSSHAVVSIDTPHS